MDVLVAPGLAPPATLPSELVAPQGINVFRAASTAWASDVSDDPASTTWSARLLGDVELTQSAVDALGIGGRVALGLAVAALPSQAHDDHERHFPSERLEPAVDKEGLVNTSWASVPQPIPSGSVSRPWWWTLFRFSKSSGAGTFTRASWMG